MTYANQTSIISFLSYYTAAAAAAALRLYSCQLLSVFQPSEEGRGGGCMLGLSDSSLDDHPACKSSNAGKTCWRNEVASADAAVYLLLNP